MVMNMATFHPNIPIQRIKEQDSLYRLRPAREVTRLANSIREYGLICPLRVEKCSSGFRVICGFRRLRAAREQGLASLPCFVHQDKSGRMLFDMALEENLLTRGLEELEKAEAIAKLRHHFEVPEDEILTKYLPRLDLRPDRYHLQRCLDISRFPERFKRALEEGLDVETAFAIDTWQTAEQVHFLELVGEYEPGRNVQRELVSLLGDLRKMEDADTRTIWESAAGRSNAGQDRRPSAASLNGIIETLKKRRYPTIADYENRYQQLRQELKIPPQIRLQPPPYFEGNYLSVQFRATEVEDFAKKAERLVEISRNQALVKIFELL